MRQLFALVCWKGWDYRGRRQLDLQGVLSGDGGIGVFTLFAPVCVFMVCRDAWMRVGVDRASFGRTERRFMFYRDRVLSRSRSQCPAHAPITRALGKTWLK